MKTDQAHETSKKPVLRRYEGYGLLGGLGLGVFVGVLISGPHFYEWSAALSLAVIFGAGVAGAAIGRLAAGIAVGSLAGGAGSGAGPAASVDVSDGGGGGDASDGDGGA
jgi:hypothetical protein